MPVSPVPVSSLFGRNARPRRRVTEAFVAHVRGHLGRTGLTFRELCGAAFGRDDQSTYAVASRLVNRWAYVDSDTARVRLACLAGAVAWPKNRPADEEL